MLFTVANSCSFFLSFSAGVQSRKEQSRCLSSGCLASGSVIQVRLIVFCVCSTTALTNHCLSFFLLWCNPGRRQIIWLLIFLLQPILLFFGYKILVIWEKRLWVAVSVLYCLPLTIIINQRILLWSLLFCHGHHYWLSMMIKWQTWFQFPVFAKHYIEFPNVI